MSGLEQVKEAIAGALEEAGLSARISFTPGWVKEYHEPVVAVGLRTGESRGGALGSYLGQRLDPETQAYQEVYGMQLELTVSLDIYGPPEKGAGECDRALETLHQTVLGKLPSGLKPTELKWEETVWDADTGMFLRRGSLRCGAYFTARANEEGNLLHDFILRGVMTK